MRTANTFIDHLAQLAWSTFGHEDLVRKVISYHKQLPPHALSTITGSTWTLWSVTLDERLLSISLIRYKMWDAETDDDAAFEKRMDGLCREIGTRAQQALPEAVPPEAVPATTPMRAAPPAATASSAKPAVAPAPILAPVPAPSPAPQLMAPERSFTRTSQPATPQTQQVLVSNPGVDARGSFSEMVCFMREEREHTEARLAAQEAKLEVQRHETEKLRQEMFESQLQAAQAAMPHEVISTEQVDALMARLEVLHSAKLLSDDELFALEDMITDFAEARAALGAVTMEVVHTNHAAGKVHKLLSVSEAVPRDTMLARQLRRKFV